MIGAEALVVATEIVETVATETETGCGITTVEIVACTANVEGLVVMIGMGMAMEMAGEE